MKVFLTVGSMLPFDRLVRAMDAFAASRPDVEIFAQIGETKYRPAHMKSCAMMSPADYREKFVQADVVVSHVGMGTVITAAEIGKPLVMLAREMALHEVTSTHQQATGRWLEGRPGIHIVATAAELGARIDEVYGARGVGGIGAGTRDALVRAVREFIAG